MTKIAIPSDDRTTMAPHFGRTAGFLVFHHDSNGMTSEYRPVAEGPQSGCCGGDGPSRHERILSALGDCDVVIASGMGDHMLGALYGLGVEVVFSSVTDARQAAEMLVSDLLPVQSGSGCCQH